MVSLKEPFHSNFTSVTKGYFHMMVVSRIYGTTIISLQKSTCIAIFYYLCQFDATTVLHGM